MIINKHTLDNGLRIVHVQDSSTQMVALNILYDVGSRDEHPEHTGFAHLFEHLMFGGSKNVPDFDIPMQQAGGECNAWTNADVTNFYATLPAHHLETALWMESDRMMSLDLSEKSLEVQRKVVMEEFKQRCLNLPYGDVAHLMSPLCYQVHPYRWPVIGMELSHIANATLEEVSQFYHRFYVPNRAVLAITGNISWDKALCLVSQWFEDIPRGEEHVRNLPQEPRQTHQRRKSVERAVPQDALFMSFHTAPFLTTDYFVTDIISDILCNGASSRLKQRLVHERELFTYIDAPITGTRDAGLLEVKAKLRPGVSLEQAEMAVWEELDTLKHNPIGDYELEKVKNKLESAQTFGNINYQRVAYRLAWFELNEKAELIDEEPQCYRAVSTSDILRVANELFHPDNASVLYYHKSE
ncbi:MAG: insulinase family protein [Bacteroidaceae bacterium]|nr:insulinase family protein [Bacteroidaceae bacterium]